MPGMENAAPERTETSSGSLRVAEASCRYAASSAASAASISARGRSGMPLAVVRSTRAGLGGDGEARAPAGRAGSSRQGWRPCRRGGRASGVALGEGVHAVLLAKRPRVLSDALVMSGPAPRTAPHSAPRRLLDRQPADVDHRATQALVHGFSVTSSSSYISERSAYRAAGAGREIAHTAAADLRQPLGLDREADDLPTVPLRTALSGGSTPLTMGILAAM